jgi:hypothetical protein
VSNDGTPSSARSSLFYDLFDDAAMFPPQEAAAAVAVPDHVALTHGPHAEYVGPLLVSIGRLDEFAAVEREDSLSIALVGRPTAALVPDRTDVVGVEQVWDGAPIEPADVGARLALEPAGHDVVDDLLEVVGEARIDGAPVIAKFRTGGVAADAFPSEAELAYCLLGAYNAGVPFKLTAGLHHAVRHTAASGFEHHGFLNVMVATSRCHEGADEAAVADALAVREASPLVDVIRSWSVDDGLRVRSSFTSFGCCGVEDPVRDLVALELIEAGAGMGAGR